MLSSIQILRPSFHLGSENYRPQSRLSLRPCFSSINQSTHQIYSPTNLWGSPQSSCELPIPIYTDVNTVSTGHVECRLIIIIYLTKLAANSKSTVNPHSDPQNVPYTQERTIIRENTRTHPARVLVVDLVLHTYGTLA